MNTEVKAITESWQEKRQRFLQWGLEEIEHRKRDLEDKSPLGLALAKANAENRRRRAGLDANQASIWMREAKKHRKNQALESQKALRIVMTDIPTTEGAAW